MNGRPANDIVIDVRNLSKSFGGNLAVDGLTMQVRRGQIYGFLGPNGSGKTTTIRMLCGLLTPDSGEGRTLGYDIFTENHLIKPRVGYMTQRFSLYTDLTVKENLDFTAALYRLSEPREKVRGALEWLGLTGRRNQLAGQLSGGWKQRLALGAALLPEPDLLLLDEPTAGVDPKARREFWDRIFELARRGITVLVSTHYMDEAERCHEITYLSYGHVLARGTVDEVIDESGLATFIVSGRGAGDLAGLLAQAPGVEMVAPFGNTLHVSGTDETALERALASVRDEAGIHVQRGTPSLEDVFIHLMGEAGTGNGRASAVPGGGP
ncbi:MAG: ATP-binding cassette domain-containing protein [Alphaproteobacteria bacterium]